MSYHEMNKIIDHLYITNWETSDNPTILKRNNIKAIITLEMMPKSDFILKYYKDNGIDHMYIYIPDIPQANISEHFDETYKFIDNHISKGDNVLVHCRAGVSRSATIILNYLIRKSYETNQVHVCPCNLLKNVLNYAKTKRSVINPNPGFQKQLLMAAMKYNQFLKKR
jgi:protein-tyrosine phosphatase